MKSKNQPVIVGLDIGTSKIVAVAARKNEYGKIEILGLGQAISVGVSNSMVLNVEQCMHSINSAITNCMASNPDLEIKDVYIGIGGQHIQTIQTRGDRFRKYIDDEISEKDIDILISEQYKTFIPETDQIIDIIPHNFTVDTIAHVLNPVGMNGAKLSANFHVITADKNVIKNMRRSVDKASLNIKNIFLQPLASAMALTSEEDREAGVAVVDIGAGTTDITIFSEGVLKHVAVIPCGSDNITNDIRNGLGLLRSQAEQLKVLYGMALVTNIDPAAVITVQGLRGLPAKEISLKSLYILIEEAMQEILDYVVFQLKQLHLDKSLHGGIILTGGGAQLKNIKKLTEQITGMSVRIGNLNDYLMESQLEKYSNPGFISGISLIVKACNDYEIAHSGNIAEEMEPLPVKERNVPQNTNETIILKVPVKNALPEVSDKKGTKMLQRLANTLRDKFMELFEDVDKEVL